MNSGKAIESKEQLVEWFKLGNKTNKIEGRYRA